MSFLEIVRQMGYSIIGASCNLINYYQTYLTSRAACEHKLGKYLRPPRYYGYLTREDAKAAWQYFLQTGIVRNASDILSAQPITPQRNRQTNLQSPPSLHPSPHSLPNSPTASQHGANHSSPAARGVGFLPPPQYSAFPLLSQPRVLITRQGTDSSYFIVIVGYAPGVYATW